jgi:hypothetical protein
MKNIVCALAGLVVLGTVPASAWAQASCSSDGVPVPTAIFERFLSADCEACWSDRATPGPSAGSSAVVLDWIVPGVMGEDAPLSAAATRDAVDRLQSLARAAPATTDIHVHMAGDASAPAPRGLRVAHGIPFNDYVGASIHFTPPRRSAKQILAAPGHLHYYLVLAEAVPAGAEGTAVPRNIVRNMLHGIWDKREPLLQKEQTKWMEARSMRIPEGARVERLRMVGWVEDSTGRAVAAAQSACR